MVKPLTLIYIFLQLQAIILVPTHISLRPRQKDFLVFWGLAKPTLNFITNTGISTIMLKFILLFKKMKVSNIFYYIKRWFNAVFTYIYILKRN